MCKGGHPQTRLPAGKRSRNKLPFFMFVNHSTQYRFSSISNTPKAPSQKSTKNNKANITLPWMMDDDVLVVPA